MNNEKLRDEYYVSKERMKEFFDKYTKLTFVSMDDHLFSQPPSHFPSIFHKVIVSWEGQEYRVSFHMCDHNEERPWFYNFQTNLPEGDDLRVGYHCFDYCGLLSEMRMGWFVHGDGRLETIKLLENKPQIRELERDIKSLESDLVTLKLWRGVSIEELTDQIRLITDKINVLSEGE